MAVFIEWPSGTVGHYAKDRQYPIWCDSPEDWEGLDCQLVDQQVTRGMIERARPPKLNVAPAVESVRPRKTRRRKVNNMKLKGDDTTIIDKGTTYE